MRSSFLNCRIVMFIGTLVLCASLVNAQEQVLRDRWLQVEAENFTVISQLSARQTLRYTNMLENWRRVAAFAISGAQGYPSARIPEYVYLFDSVDNYQAFTLTDEPGFFSPTPRANFMAIIDGNDDSAGIAFHHYVHFLLRNFSDLRLPRWYEEALAGYVSRMEVDGNDVEFERFTADNHELMIALSETLSMDRLLFRDEALASPRVIQIANLKSETLLHYFLHAHEEDGFIDRRQNLRDYLNFLLEGRNPRFAYDQAFDVTPAQLDEEFHHFLATSSRPRGTIDTVALVNNTDYEALPIDEAPLAILLAELALNSGKFENAQLFFQVAVDSGQDIARSFSGLGDALRMQEADGESGQSDQQITRYFEQAIALAPDDPVIHLDYGEFWESELLDCDKDWPQAQRERIIADINQHFTQAIAMVPDSPEANLAMGQLYLFPEMNYEQGLPYQQRAFDLLPADTFILEQSAKYAIAAANFTEAERLIDELAQPIHFWGEPGWVTDLRQRLLSKRNGTQYDECAM